MCIKLSRKIDKKMSVGFRSFAIHPSIYYVNDKEVETEAEEISWMTIQSKSDGGSFGEKLIFHFTTVLRLSRKSILIFGWQLGDDDKRRRRGRLLYRTDGSGGGGCIDRNSFRIHSMTGKVTGRLYRTEKEGRTTRGAFKVPSKRFTYFSDAWCYWLYSERQSMGGCASGFGVVSCECAWSWVWPLLGSYSCSLSV